MIHVDPAEVLDALCALTRTVAGSPQLNRDDMLWSAFTRAVNIIGRVKAEMVEVA